MKVIDLLNKIANGEEVPKKIKYDENLYFYCKPCNIYEIDGNDDLCGKDLYNMLDNLNDEVEIIEEEKEIEKIIIKDMKIQAQSTGNYCYSISQPMKIIINKLNEVIDTTKKLEKNLKEQIK